jgi:SAM-dependent methyltransferase
VSASKAASGICGFPGLRHNRGVVDAQAHWEQLYQEQKPEQLSWYQRTPGFSLALIEEASLRLDAAILDVGGGTSRLAGHLVAAGYTDVTVADISEVALERARDDLGAAGTRVTWVQADVRFHDFARCFDLWHDRAVFHFLIKAADRDRYVNVLRRTLRPGGHAILATFSPDGPTHCSGLPVARYRAEELLRIVGADFELVSSRLDLHRTPSGRIQPFTYALLREKAGERRGGSVDG